MAIIKLVKGSVIRLCWLRVKGLFYRSAQGDAHVHFAHDVRSVRRWIMGPARLLTVPGCDYVLQHAERTAEEANAKSRPIAHLRVKVTALAIWLTASLLLWHIGLRVAIWSSRRNPKAEKYDDETWLDCHRASIKHLQRLDALRQEARIVALPSWALRRSSRLIKRYLDDIAMSKAADKLLAGLEQYQINEEDKHILIHAP